MSETKAPDPITDEELDEWNEVYSEMDTLCSRRILRLIDEVRRLKAELERVQASANLQLEEWGRERKPL